MTMRARRTFRRKGNYVWTAALASNNTIPPGGQFTFPVVIMTSDYNVGISQASATLMRIRGQIMIGVNGANTFPTGDQLSVLGYCAVFDDDELTLPDATQPLTYTDEDILATYAYHGYAQGSAAAGPMNSANGQMFDIDIKARRRLTSGKNVQIVFNNPANAGGVSLTGIVRALLKVS